VTTPGTPDRNREDRTRPRLPQSAMTTTTGTLAAWLQAQLATDEALARAATPGPWETRYGFPAYVSAPGSGVTINAVTADMEPADAAHIAANDPAATLARIEATRKVLALHEVSSWYSEVLDAWIATCSSCSTPEDEMPCPTIHALASQYADRDGWREEWA
jgi:hypothetical protein